jgi:hypothetical protein
MRYALPFTVLLTMSGAVVAANPGHYGPFGIVIGLGMVLLGGVLTVRLFRAVESGSRSGLQAGAENAEFVDDRPVDDEAVDDRPMETQ